jgi:hypothetical protein
LSQTVEGDLVYKVLQNLNKQLLLLGRRSMEQTALRHKGNLYGLLC